MVPPWKAFPEIAPGSIGWRMGDGEDYGMRFGDWFRSKNTDAKRLYASENPEPEGWEGFYARL